MQFCTFAAFNAAWTALTLHLTNHFGWSTGQAGLFGLVGLAAGLLTPLAGKQTDRRGALPVVGICLALGALAAVLLATAGSTLAGLALAMFALTIATQCAQVAHQTRIFADIPHARSSANTLYMFATFLGGSAGAQTGTTIYAHGGLPHLSILIILLITTALLGYVHALRRARRIPA